MNSSRTSVYQWLFERQLQWIAQAEVKVGALVTVDVGMIGGLAAAYGTVSHRSHWMILLSIGACFLLVTALLFCALCLLPRLQAPNRSMLFFGTIAEKQSVDFVCALRTMSIEEIEDDFALQIHRNAEIARDKHKWVRRATFASFISGMPWLSAIYLLVRA